jgi:hypothetical protein
MILKFRDLVSGVYSLWIAILLRDIAGRSGGNAVHIGPGDALSRQIGSSPIDPITFMSLILPK